MLHFGGRLPSWCRPCRGLGQAWPNPWHARTVSFLYAARGFPHETSLASREEKYIRIWTLFAGEGLTRGRTVFSFTATLCTKNPFRLRQHTSCLSTRLTSARFRRVCLNVGSWIRFHNGCLFFSYVSAICRVVTPRQRSSWRLRWFTTGANVCVSTCCSDWRCLVMEQVSDGCLYLACTCLGIDTYGVSSRCDLVFARMVSQRYLWSNRAPSKYDILVKRWYARDGCRAAPILWFVRS